jgi:cytochrome c oxidase assembly protein subunit 15
LPLVCLQVALGGWVSTNYAVLACNEFPQCQGSWWPYMEFREGFALWRELGKTSTGEHIGFGALTAIHYVHRLAAYGVFALLGLLAWRLRHVHALRAQARWIAGLAACGSSSPACPMSCWTGRWSQPSRTRAALPRWWWC